MQLEFQVTLIVEVDMQLEDGTPVVKSVDDAVVDGVSWNLPLDLAANGVIEEVQSLVDQDQEDIKEMLTERSAAIWEDE